MKRWDQRPLEVRNLFNAGFCGLVLLRGMQGFEEENPDGMPFSLTPLVLPLCLHKATREVIAKSPRSYLLKIIESNPEVLIGFADRTRDMLPFTLEALGIAMQYGCFDVTQDGRLKTTGGRVRRSVTGTSETISCQRVARILGKAFARIADRVTIYTSFGIRP
jgi:hypothetical protein